MYRRRFGARPHTDGAHVDDPDFRAAMSGRGYGRNPLAPQGPVTPDTIRQPPVLVDPKRWAWNQIETARAGGYATREMEEAAATVIGQAEFDRMSGRGPVEEEL